MLVTNIEQQGAAWTSRFWWLIRGFVFEPYPNPALVEKRKDKLYVWKKMSSMRHQSLAIALRYADGLPTLA